MIRICKFIIIFIMLIVIFNLLLFVASIFPSKWLENNVRESSKLLEKEGNYYSFFENYNVKNNNYTDALIINEAYSIDNSNAFNSYMTARKNYQSGLTKENLLDNYGESVSVHITEKYDPVGELAEFLQGNITVSMNYSRYWHGYLILIRPMLIILNISQIRIFLLIIFILLFILLLVLLSKKLGLKVALVWSITLILEDYFFVSYSLESAPVFIIMMLACIILLIRVDKIKDWYLFIFVVACITNFFDYLTVPLITLGMPLYIYILYNKNMANGSKSSYFKLIIKSSIIWGLGYAMTWISKWLLYDFIYREGLIYSAIKQVLYRSSLSSEINVMELFKQLFNFMLDKIAYVILFSQISLFCVLIYDTFIQNKVIHKNKVFVKFNKSNAGEYIELIVIAFMPFVWYVVLSNHTMRHGIFVYRHLLIFFTGIFLYIATFFDINKKKLLDSNKKE